ncbi:hypothetical protein AUP68_09672 [Ilyonectria robusta]
MRGSLNPLRHLATLAVEYDQVPNEVRCCLELLRTCDQDLQRLIELRNEHLVLLEKQPEALDRVNKIIEAAQTGLVEVCEIVEKCRPEAHRGKTPFRNRMKWIFVDSMLFRNQEPVISRHHTSVLAELIFVRQIVLWAPVAEQQKKIEQSQSIEKSPPVFENIALLGELMGDVSASNHSPISTPDNAPATLTPPPLASLNLSQTTLSSWPSSSMRHDLNDSSSKPALEGLNPSLNQTPPAFPILVYDDEKEVVQDRQEKTDGERIVLNPNDNSGLSLLFGDGTEVTPCSSPQIHAASVASVSQISLDYTLPAQQVTSLSTPVSGRLAADLSIMRRTTSNQLLTNSDSKDELTEPTPGWHQPKLTHQSSLPSVTSHKQPRQHRASLSTYPANIQPQSTLSSAHSKQQHSSRPSSTGSSWVPPVTSSSPQPQAPGLTKSVSDVTSLRHLFAHSVPMTQTPVTKAITQSGKMQSLSNIPPELIHIHKK